MRVDERRMRTLKAGDFSGETVLYVMGRDFRAEDNWALLYAQQIATEHKVPVAVLVHMGKNLIETNERQHSFFVDGLRETAEELERHNIPFFITYGDWKKEVKQFVELHKVGAIVTDFSPLHEMRWWWNEVSHGVKTPIYEVDAHNIVPCWIASDKEEFAAYTFRTKMRTHYPEFKGVFPKLREHPYAWGAGTTECWPRGINHEGCAVIDWAGVKAFRAFESEVMPVSGCLPGTKEAHRVLKRFIKERLSRYENGRNDPTQLVLSDLSPYIRFGFISAQRIAYEIEKVRGSESDKKAFLEELIVRRELAENFCFYQENYNNYEGLRDWAKKTLKAHEGDEREYTYTFEEFENAETHDEIWNAAQKEMVKRGKMHGYMRMYWAKKILEWSTTPEEAIATAVTLNDRYSLDGRDPNGYVGVLWSIGGIHDRPWFERPIYGQIRYMNDKGCRRKFDVDQYIETVGKY